MNVIHVNPVANTFGGIVFIWRQYRKTISDPENAKKNHLRVNNTGITLIRFNNCRITDRVNFLCHFFYYRVVNLREVFYVCSKIYSRQLYLQCDTSPTAIFFYSCVYSLKFWFYRNQKNGLSLFGVSLMLFLCSFNLFF